MGEAITRRGISNLYTVDDGISKYKIRLMGNDWMPNTIRYLVPFSQSDFNNIDNIYSGIWHLFT